MGFYIGQGDNTGLNWKLLSDIVDREGIPSFLQGGYGPSGEYTSLDNNWRDITYGNGKFVALNHDGDPQKVMTSADGINWTLHSAPPLDSGQWVRLAYGNGIFVGVKHNSDDWMYSSDGGESWTAVTGGGQVGQWSGITWGNGIFVAVNYNNGDTYQVQTSPDGITWTTRVSSYQSRWRRVAYGNGKFVAVGSYGGTRIMTSPDGINWTNPTVEYGSIQSFRDIAFGNGIFVALANQGFVVRTSSDGENWGVAGIDYGSSIVNLPFLFWEQIVFGGGLFIVSDTAGRVNYK